MLQPELQSETEAVAQAALASIGAWEAREARPVVKGVCIDSDHSLDRDDAIWFEETDDGKLIVDVTIADVASFISKDSLLDKRARRMVETEYGADHVIDPMLPFRLSQDDEVDGNGVFSLSDKTIRAGMTTRITLDLRTKTLANVEVFSSLILPEIINYQKVAQHLKNDPKGRYGKWAEYTAILKAARRKGNEGVLPVTLNDEMSNTLTHISEEGFIEELSQEESAASKMVEETALLANRANAQLFAACSLPYLFRVHQVKLEGTGAGNRGYHYLNEAEDARQALMMQPQQSGDIKLVLERATYAARRLPHAALGEYAYSHSTSPIRRYPDIPNQRMQHWLADTIAELSWLIGKALPSVSPDMVTSYMGRLRANPETDIPLNGTKLLGWVGRLRMVERESLRKHCLEKVQKYLIGSLRDLSSDISLDKLHDLALELTRQLSSQIKPPPYSHAEMEAVANEVNLNRSGKHLSERERLAQKLVLTQIERQLELAELQVLTALETQDHKDRCQIISEFSAEKRFPLTLHLSAQQKMEYRVPADEILERMQNGRLREPSDLATILVQMKTPALEHASDDPAFADEASQDWLKQNIEAWQDLKEAILSRFAANPSFTKGFLKYLEERYAWEIHSTHASLIAEGAIAAIMSLNPQPALPAQESARQTLFPPNFSIGHWGKTTRHHARLELLHALAHDRLLPSDDVKLPRALRLMTASGFEELICTDSNTLKYLKEKTEAAGIKLEKHWNKENQHYHLQASTQTEDRDPITFTASAADKITARALAWQALLRGKLMRPVHEDLFLKREQLQAIPIDADDAIDWLGKHSDIITQTLQLSSTNQFTQRREPIWQARLDLHINEATRRQFIGESTQAEVAATFANEAGLRYLRERVDYGDSKIEEALQSYEKQVTQRYAQGEVLSSKVPYTAKMNGRDIIPAENRPLA